ncbi:uncharacterized protein LOC122509634 [Leptopilina heterotoma]|uniref:uncharacterized protein LOC122509634 n=1 Tax=Leptopilina heterotoma TaxID=63436 RepID=UPI001CA7EE12|nr:uncharacterized protein LOC122509634 [Leptopilina heterotoma]
MYLTCSFIFFIFLKLQDVEILAQEPSAYCFRFTWLGPMVDNSKVNCSIIKNTPCVKPFFNSSTPPILTDLWSNKDQYTCSMNPGYVCIKHTFIYNNAVINSTHFCGKMIEDKTTAITSNCYTQQVDGHTIESCACLSDRGMRPCNSAKINEYSFLFLFILFLTKMV